MSDLRMTIGCRVDIFRCDSPIGARHDHDRVFAAFFDRNDGDSAGGLVGFDDVGGIDVFAPQVLDETTSESVIADPSDHRYLAAGACRRDRLICTFSAWNLGR